MEERLLTTITVNVLIPVKDDTISIVQEAIRPLAESLKSGYYGVGFKYFPPLETRDSQEVR